MLSVILRAKLLPLPLPLVVLGCSFGGAIGLGTTRCIAVPAHPLWSQLLAEPRLPAWVTWAGWPRPGDVEEDVVRLSQMSPSDLCSFFCPQRKGGAFLPTELNFHFPIPYHAALLTHLLGRMGFGVSRGQHSAESPFSQNQGLWWAYWEDYMLKARGYPPSLLVPFLSFFALPAPLRVGLVSGRSPWASHSGSIS